MSNSAPLICTSAIQKPDCDLLAYWTHVSSYLCLRNVSIFQKTSLVA